MDTALYICKKDEKEDEKMKDITYTKKLTYIGAGCGVILFAVFGLLPGTFLGGVMGLNMAGLLVGGAASSEILSRVIVAASMVAGVMVSGIVFITVSSIAGWVIGTIVDVLTADKKDMAAIGHK